MSAEDDAIIQAVAKDMCGRNFDRGTGHGDMTALRAQIVEAEWRAFVDDAKAAIAAYLGSLEAMGWAVVRKDMTDEMTRCHLAVDKPATYRTHLRHPDNGPRLSAEVEAEVATAQRRHAAVIPASPKPPGMGD